jgi:hypothetical protein
VDGSSDHNVDALIDEEDDDTTRDEQRLLGSWQSRRMVVVSQVQRDVPFPRLRIRTASGSEACQVSIPSWMVHGKHDEFQVSTIGESAC